MAIILMLRAIFREYIFPTYKEEFRIVLSANNPDLKDLLIWLDTDDASLYDALAQYQESDFQKNRPELMHFTALFPPTYKFMFPDDLDSARREHLNLLCREYKVAQVAPSTPGTGGSLSNERLVNNTSITTPFTQGRRLNVNSITTTTNHEEDSEGEVNIISTRGRGLRPQELTLRAIEPPGGHTSNYAPPSVTTLDSRVSFPGSSRMNTTTTSLSSAPSSYNDNSFQSKRDWMLPMNTTTEVYQGNTAVSWKKYQPSAWRTFRDHIKQNINMTIWRRNLLIHDEVKHKLNFEVRLREDAMLRDQRKWDQWTHDEFIASLNAVMDKIAIFSEPSKDISSRVLTPTLDVIPAVEIFRGGETEFYTSPTPFEIIDNKMGTWEPTYLMVSNAAIIKDIKDFCKKLRQYEQNTYNKYGKASLTSSLDDQAIAGAFKTYAEFLFAIKQIHETRREDLISRAYLAPKKKFTNDKEDANNTTRKSASGSQN